MVWGCAEEVEELVGAAAGWVVGPKCVQGVGRDTAGWCGVTSGKDAVHMRTVWAASGGGQGGWEAGVEAANAWQHGGEKGGNAIQEV